jgi:hypothetical protein
MVTDADDEIRDSPLLAMFRMEERRQQNGSLSVERDVPHLVFEITSDDGFSVQADSFKSEFHLVQVLLTFFSHLRQTS